MSSTTLTSPTAFLAVPAPNAILTTAEVAAWLRVHPRQVQRLGVPCLNLGHKTKRYRAADVIAWLAKQARRKA